MTHRDDRYQRLHEAVISDPEAVWLELRQCVCDVRHDAHDPALVDLIEDLMFWHSDAFVERLERLVVGQFESPSP